MPRSLYYLVKASGYSGVSGQSFRNHVNNAASGVHMTDYNCTGWTWDSAGQPTSLAWPYASGTSWAMTFTFDENSLARKIRRLVTDGLGETVRVVSYSADADIVNEQIEITSRTLSNSSSAGAATLRIIASQPPSGQTAGVHGTGIIGGTEYESGSLPSSGPPSQLATMRNRLTVLSPGTPRDVTYTVNVDYIFDIGPYNPTLTKQFVVKVTDRTVVDSDLDVRWYTAYNDESSYIGSSNPIELDQSFVGQDFFLYYKWRVHGASSWNGDGTGGNGATLGPAGFEDTRIA